MMLVTFTHMTQSLLIKLINSTINFVFSQQNKVETLVSPLSDSDNNTFMQIKKKLERTLGFDRV
jgi:hypothetical protein